MNARGRIPTILLSLWLLAAAVIYFRQFAAPALLYLSRMMGRH
jgi:hypothetical protein